MDRRKKVWFDAAVLTAVSFLLRGAGLVFQIIVTNRLGAEGLGLFQLVLSVQALAVTLATSGMRYVVTRLISEELGRGRIGDARAVLRKCFAFSLILSLLASILLRLLAGTAADLLICDGRTTASLEILAFGLPFVSLTSVTGGYFTAVRRSAVSAVVQIFEQACMIAATLILLPTAAHSSGAALENACASICKAAVLADAASFILAAVLCRADSRRLGFGHRGAGPRGVTSRILSLGAPIAVTAWARTALSTLKHLLVPATLRRSGETAVGALEAYGVIQGMVFPVLAFPSALFYSIAEVLLPDLTEAQIRGDTQRLNDTVTRILRMCLMVSVGAAGIFLAFGNGLGKVLYNSTEAGSYITILAPYVIVMYMDAITDGMLRGLGEQLWSMGVNLIDALISLALVRFLVPVLAVNGYIGVIFFSELFNFSLSLLRLTRRVSIRFRAGDLLLLPPLCAAGAISFSCLVLSFSGLSSVPEAVSVAVHIALSAAVYAALSLILEKARAVGVPKIPTGC